MYLSASRAFIGGVGRTGGGAFNEGESERCVFAVATVDEVDVVLVVEEDVETVWPRVGAGFEGVALRREAICVFGCVVVRAFVLALCVVVRAFVLALCVVVLVERVGLDAVAFVVCVEPDRVVGVRASRRPSAWAMVELLVVVCVVPVDRGAVVWVLVGDLVVCVEPGDVELVVGVVDGRGACVVGAAGARVVGTVGGAGFGADGRGAAPVEVGGDPPFGCASAEPGRATASPTRRRTGTRIGAAGSKRHATRTMCESRRISPTYMDPLRSSRGLLGSSEIPRLP